MNPERVTRFNLSILKVAFNPFLNVIPLLLPSQLLLQNYLGEVDEESTSRCSSVPFYELSNPAFAGELSLMYYGPVICKGLEGTGSFSRRLAPESMIKSARAHGVQLSANPRRKK